MIPKEGCIGLKLWRCVKYEQWIALLQKLLNPEGDRCSGLRFSASSDSEALRPVAGFEPEAMETEWQSRPMRRVRLNPEQ